jgi:hypothetical protein
MIFLVCLPSCRKVVLLSVDPIIYLNPAFLKITITILLTANIITTHKLLTATMIQNQITHAILLWEWNYLLTIYHIQDLGKY